MEGLPRRHTLVNQTVSYLKAKIENRDWNDRLPCERRLAEMMHVSRNTLRSALAQLRREGLVRSRQGSGNTILKGSARSSRRLQARDVGLLAPLPLLKLRPFHALWIDELRGLLNERSHRLHVFHDARCFGAYPGRALRQLTTVHGHAGWILVMARENTLRWFKRSGLPTIVAGSTYPGIEIPFLDFSFRAICRHAVGVLSRAGHTRIGLISFRTNKLGVAAILEAEAGFNEGMQLSKRGTAAEGRICCHDTTLAGICSTVRRVMALPSRPTGLIVLNSQYFLTVAGQLQQIGLEVPRDVSLICTDGDPFLNFVVRQPARYVCSPQTFAKGLLGQILGILERGAAPRQSALLMPEFIRGESIAEPGV